MMAYVRYTIQCHFTSDTAPLQFQQQVPGNIIPLPAFVKQMANTVIDGEPAVSARVVSFWQGFAEMAKMTGMFMSYFFADRIGRKYVSSPHLAANFDYILAER